MSLAPQLGAVYDNFQKTAPAHVTQHLNTVNSELGATFKTQTKINVGDRLPDFALSNAFGKECPFCNLTLRSLQLNMDKFQAKGVTLVAISPELPNTSLSTTEKHDLKFPVLSDVGNKFARELGVVFPMPDSMRTTFKAFGNDLVERNGDDSFVIPVSATLLVDEKGIVRNTYINPNFWERLEPSTAVEWIESL